MNKQERIIELVHRGKALIDRAELEGRDRTPDETLEGARLLKEIHDLKRGAALDEVGRQIGTESSVTWTDPNVTLGGGWERLGKSINLKAGQTKAEVALDGLMRTKDGTWPDAEDFPPLRAPAVGAAYDTRYLYPNLARQALGQELSVSEFRQVGAAEVASGSVERYPTDTATKAEVDVELEHVSEKVKQVAAVISDVPNAILETDVTLRAFLQQQLRVKLDQAIDAHCLAQIEAASFAGGSTGANLIEQIRNAISAMAAVGTRPTIVALSPEDAVELDLFSTGSDDAYVFPLRDSGSSSPLFSLRVIDDQRDRAAVDRPGGARVALCRAGEVRGRSLLGLQGEPEHGSARGQHPLPRQKPERRLRDRWLIRPWTTRTGPGGVLRFRRRRAPVLPSSHER